MSTVRTPQAQIGTNQADAKCTMQKSVCQSTVVLLLLLLVWQNFISCPSTRIVCLAKPTQPSDPKWAELDSPRSERCAATQRWAGRCRCYSSSLWTSLHPRRPQTSSSSETTQPPPNRRTYEYDYSAEWKSASGPYSGCWRCMHPILI